MVRGWGIGRKGAEGTGRSFKKWPKPLNSINFSVDLKVFLLTNTIRPRQTLKNACDGLGSGDTCQVSAWDHAFEGAILDVQCNFRSNSISIGK